MKNKMLSILALAGTVFVCAEAIAATADTSSKPVSKVSDVKSMPDDTEVVVEGVIVQDLGNDNYLLQDDSGTVVIEIDDDLVEGNNLVPQAMVLITATVDQDGNVTSLEAEEVDFVPNTANAAQNAASVATNAASAATNAAQNAAAQ